MVLPAASNSSSTVDMALLLAAVVVDVLAVVVGALVLDTALLLAAVVVDGLAVVVGALVVVPGATSQTLSEIALPEEQLLLTNGDESNRGLKDFSIFSRWLLSDDWRVRETAVAACISLSEIPEVLPSVQRILKARVLIKTTEPPCEQNVLKSKKTLDIVMKTAVDKTVEGFIGEYSANVGEALPKETKSGLKRAVRYLLYAPTSFFCIYELKISHVHCAMV
eukprot:g6226.t1